MSVWQGDLPLPPEIFEIVAGFMAGEFHFGFPREPQRRQSPNTGSY